MEKKISNYIGHILFVDDEVEFLDLMKDVNPADQKSMDFVANYLTHVELYKKRKSG